MAKALTVLPQWLPIAAQAYILGAESLSKGYAQKQVALKQILPAFINNDMKPVWQKIEALHDDAAFAYTLAIAGSSQNYEAAKEIIVRLRDESAELKKALTHSHKIAQTLKRLAITYPTIFENALEEHTKMADHLQQMQSVVFQTSKPPITIPYLGKLTKKFNTQEATIRYCVNALTNVVRTYSRKSLHKEVALTINAIYGLEYGPNDVAKIVGKNL